MLYLLRPEWVNVGVLLLSTARIIPFLISAVGAKRLELPPLRQLCDVFAGFLSLLAASTRRRAENWSLHHQAEYGRRRL